MDVDSRPRWCREFDDGRVPYAYTHRHSRVLHTHFRIPVPLSLMEVLCVDTRCPSLSVHTRRVDYMWGVPPERFVRIVYRRVMEWYPHSDHGIDGTKWIKLLRETEVFPDLKKPVRLSQMDIIFKVEAKGPQGYSDKYVNLAGFSKMLHKVAVIRYPIDEDVSALPGNHTKELIAQHLARLAEEAYTRLVQHHIASLTAWLAPAWEEAKLQAMGAEALRYCPATRVAAFYRGRRMHYYFSIYISCVTALQANVRRHLVLWRLRRLRAALQRDWVYRWRVHCAILLQSVVRRFTVRCRYTHTVSTISVQLYGSTLAG